MLQWLRGDSEVNKEIDQIKKWSSNAAGGMMSFSDLGTLGRSDNGQSQDETFVLRGLQGVLENN